LSHDEFLGENIKGEAYPSVPPLGRAILLSVCSYSFIKEELFSHGQLTKSLREFCHLAVFALIWCWQKSGHFIFSSKNSQALISLRKSYAPKYLIIFLQKSAQSRLTNSIHPQIHKILGMQGNLFTRAYLKQLTI
jgi:hypothetical protein